MLLQILFDLWKEICGSNRLKQHFFAGLHVKIGEARHIQLKIADSVVQLKV